MQTINQKYPIIRFVFNHIGREDLSLCNKECVDLIYGVFSDTSKITTFSDKKQLRYGLFWYDFLFDWQNGTNWESIGKMGRTNHLDYIHTRMIDYAMKIESAIQQNAKERVPNTVTINTEHNTTLQVQMKTLNELHAANLITDEEFSDKKKELLSKM